MNVITFPNWEGSNYLTGSNWVLKEFVNSIVLICENWRFFTLKYFCHCVKNKVADCKNGSKGFYCFRVHLKIYH